MLDHYGWLVFLLALTLGECVKPSFSLTTPPRHRRHPVGYSIPHQDSDILKELQSTRPQHTVGDVHKRPSYISRNHLIFITDLFAAECDQFAHFPGAIMIGGDILEKTGDGYTADHCKDACNAITEFVCVGALMQLPDTCFVTGYNLRDNYFSVHYSRICAKGPGCYNSRTFTSAGFTQVKDVPWYFTLSNGLAQSFCMVQCEQREECVGFDLVTLKNNKVQCKLQDPERIIDSSFDLYIRRC